MLRVKVSGPGEERRMFDRYVRRKPGLTARGLARSIALGGSNLDRSFPLIMIGSYLRHYRADLPRRWPETGVRLHPAGDQEDVEVGEVG